MAKGLITEATLTGIADAIREKAGTSAAMRPDEMAALIQGITGAKLTYGTVTFAAGSSKNTETITHNLGDIPNIFIMFQIQDGYGSLLNSSNIYVALMPDGVGRTSWATSRGASYQSGGNYFNDITATSIKVTGVSYMRGTYKWISGVAE